MAYVTNEPASGWNLPPGCFEGDPNAPWNQPDPWVGHKCAECVHCKDVKLASGEVIDVCCGDIDFMEQIDASQAADECFE